MKEYSPKQEVINNIPYAVMTWIGMIIIITCFSTSIWGIIAGFAYLFYGIAGSVWIMIFVCPYCTYWDTRSCPCGYGRIASKFRPKSTVNCFSEKFKRHIPVIVPLWFIPLLVSLPVIVKNFSWPLLALLVAFAVDAFIFLPLVSTKHGCKECPQKDTCPWMKSKIKSPAYYV
jgi:hypothetical protein